MSMTTVIYHLEERLQQAGCPICRVSEHATRRYVEFLHWESVNDPPTREAFLVSWGYCPTHTRLVAEVEQEMFKDWLGTNILYESLSRLVIGELRRTRDSLSEKKPPSRQPRWLQRFLQNKGQRPIPKCRLCEVAESAVRQSVDALLEEIEIHPEKWQALYVQSDGLCVNHLRLALQEFSSRHPAALRFVLNRRTETLERQADAMLEYIRKHIWDYRDEPKTEEELRAWRENLAFFSGYTPDSFVFDEEETKKNG